VESFIQAVSAIASKGQPIMGYSSLGIVTEITGMTCTVERDGLPPLFDVRLNAIDQSFDDMFLIIPVIGSQVLCLVVENQKAETAIVKYTEVEKVIITIGGARFEMSAGKFDFKNNQSDLKKILTETLDQLKNAIITTPSGPGQFSDPNKLKFENLKSDTEKLFK